MGMVLQIDVKPDCLYATAKGEFSLQEAELSFLEILDAIAQHKREKVLFDGRGVWGELTTMQRFYYGEFVAEAVAAFAQRGRRRAPMFAYVLKEPVLDPQRFGESVATNRGMKVKAFDNMEDALGWLGLGSGRLP